MSTDISSIAGNAPDAIKALFAVGPVQFFNVYGNGLLKKGFAETVVARIKFSEVSIAKNAIEPVRDTATVICTIKVEEDMVNGLGKIHGACSALLVDLCSTSAIVALAMNGDDAGGLTVSQSLNIVYHAPAGLDEELRIVNTTMSVGKRVLTARTEIWSSTYGRLVASGVHVKMAPSLKPDAISKM